MRWVVMAVVVMVAGVAFGAPPTQGQYDSLKKENEQLKAQLQAIHERDAKLGAATQPTKAPPVYDLTKRVEMGMTLDEAIKVFGEPDAKRLTSNGTTICNWFYYAIVEASRGTRRPINVATVTVGFAPDGKATEVQDNRETAVAAWRNGVAMEK